jgi:cytochrome c oxidase subunit 2
MKKILTPLAFILSLFVSCAAQAASAYQGMAAPWQMGFQHPATPVMERLNSVHNQLLVIITVITVFVLIAMIFICLRFNRKANPVPSKFTHNTLVEVIWTTLPIVILAYIAVISLSLHYYMQRVVDPELTVKVVGYQWYWHYDYPDNGGFGFDSTFKKDKELQPGEPRQLSVDNHLVVPVNTKVRVLITGADVIHSWAVPAFGVKRDAVPGRLNESWFEANTIGTFYGQCSQLCGVGHGFMPIVIDVVSKDDFNAWVKKQQKQANVSPPANSPEAKQEIVKVAPATDTAKAVPADVKTVAPAKEVPAANTQVPLAKPQVNTSKTKPQSVTDKSTVKSAEPADDEEKSDDTDKKSDE